MAAMLRCRCRPGVYRVSVELGGFRPLTRDGLRVATGETVRLDLELQVGASPKR